MSSETDWSLDFCLYCDKQTLGGLYCSQACRLADLENTSTSINMSADSCETPLSSTSSVPLSDFPFPTTSAIHFQLPPAFNFEQHRSSSISKSQSPPAGPQSSHHSKRTRPSSTQRGNSVNTQIPRTLSTSSSRSSLSSSISASSQGLSQNAVSQLHVYSNSFDFTRDWKRRTTLG